MQDSQEILVHIQDWIKKTVQDTGFSDVVIALSGGIDSALSATLATKALGKEHVHIVMLPYGSLNTVGLTDATLVANFLQIPNKNRYMFDIQNAVDELLKQIGEQDLSEIRKGNMMARVRMIYLFDLAKKLGAIVCGTENKTEHYLGYFTRFGDEASDMEPLRSLYKTQVWEVAKAVKIPEKIIIKDPTAGLWDGQTDEGELGFSYTQADKVLAAFLDEKKSKEEIHAMGIPEEVIEKVLLRVKNNAFKHHLPKICEL